MRGSQGATVSALGLRPGLPLGLLRGLLLVHFLGLLPGSAAVGEQAIRRLDGRSIPAAKARALVDQELQDDKVTGAEIAILNRGRLVWSHAYGSRNVEKSLLMTTSTNLWAASITKGVFATWVMGLSEQRRFDLDQPLARMLDRPLDQNEVYRESGRELVRDPQWERVTARMLLSHTSGLANFASLEEDKKLHLHFAPGTRFAYSGEGLNLLQFVIEQMLHEPIDRAMQREVFTPLGMTGTGMVWKESFAENTGLRYGADGGHIGTTHRDRARAAGSMATTVLDLAAWTEALLANKLLRPATKAQMLAPQIAIKSAHQFPTLDAHEGSEGPEVGLSYGMGWGLLEKTRYGPAFFKEGHGDGAENYLICFTRTGTCMILLTNSDNGELAFRPLLEQLIGDTVTPWVWEGYNREAVLQNEEHTRTR